MNKIYQTSSGGIVYKIENNKKLWLIGQHSQHKGWVFLKGLVGDHETNESMEDAAIREVKEEGGIEAKIVDQNPVKTHYSYQWKNDLIDKTVYYFLMEYMGGDTKNHDWEMAEAKFVDEKTLLKTLTYPSDINAFQEILKRL